MTTTSSSPQVGQQWRVWVFDFAYQETIILTYVEDGRVEGRTEDHGLFVGTEKQLQERGERVT